MPDKFAAVKLVKFAPDTAPKEPDHVPEVTVPVVVKLAEPANGDAPTVLYETVCAALPLKVVPDTAPDPPLLNVTAFVTLPADVADVADVAVAALPPMLKLATGVVDVTVNGAVPVATVDVTVEKLGVILVPIVTAPTDPETVILVPATAEVTPVFVIVTAPVAPETDIPVPATFEVTPVLLIVNVPDPVVVEIPVPEPSVATIYFVPLPTKICPFVGIVDVPVPPFATLSMPANVTAPVVAVFGVNPVVPALNDVTPAELSGDQIVPL